jgi:hypothetical protein
VLRTIGLVAAFLLLAAEAVEFLVVGAGTLWVDHEFPAEPGIDRDPGGHPVLGAAGLLVALACCLWGGWRVIRAADRDAGPRWSRDLVALAGAHGAAAVPAAVEGLGLFALGPAAGAALFAALAAPARRARTTGGCGT